jgi:hypothetical protein
MFQNLIARGFRVEFLSHAQAILSVDFPEAATELERALLASTVPIEEIMAGGGGEAKGTQRLRKSLALLHWPKFTLTIEKRINTVPRESVSHEIDHVRTFPSGARLAFDRLIDAHPQIAREFDFDHARTICPWRKQRRHSRVRRHDANGKQTNPGTGLSSGSIMPCLPAPAINQADANAVAVRHFAYCAARDGTGRQRSHPRAPDPRRGRTDQTVATVVSLFVRMSA